MPVPDVSQNPDAKIAVTYDTYQTGDSFDLLLSQEREVVILLLARGSGQHIENIVPPDVSWVRTCAYRVVFACQDTNPCVGKKVLTAADLEGAVVVSTLYPLSVTLMEGVVAFLETQEVHIRPSFKSAPSNSDVLLGNLGD